MKEKESRSVGLMPLMYFEDFQPWMTFSSQSNTVRKEDIENFAKLTGDLNKLHMDPEYAKLAGFERGIIAHGMLTLSFTIGLWHSLDLTNGTIVAFAGINNVSFKKPVYVGDSLRLKAQVLSTRASRSNPNVGLVTLKMTTVNADDDSPVAEGEVVFVLRKKESVTA
jgi:acyl dehydratase